MRPAVALLLVLPTALASSDAEAADAAALLQAVANEAGPASGGCTRKTNLQGGRVYTANVTWEEEDLPKVIRTFHIYVPHGYQHHDPNPMTIHYHGWGEDALDYHKYYGWKQTADKLNVLMVYPEGMADCQEGADCQDKHGAWKSWNAGGSSASTWRRMSCSPQKMTKKYCYKSCAIKKRDGCHPCDWASCYDDVAFTKRIMHHVKTNFCVDNTRVYAAGCSNGGLMVHELARDMPEEIAAVASMCGGKPHDGWAYMPPGGPEIPVMLFTGRQDDTIPRERPLPSTKDWEGFIYSDEDSVMEMYKNYNQCNNNETLVWEPKAGRKDKQRCKMKGFNCSGIAEVVECARDGGHDVWEDDTLMAMGFLLDHTTKRVRGSRTIHSREDWLWEVSTTPPLYDTTTWGY